MNIIREIRRLFVLSAFEAEFDPISKEDYFTLQARDKYRLDSKLKEAVDKLEGVTNLDLSSIYELILVNGVKGRRFVIQVTGALNSRPIISHIYGNEKQGLTSYEVYDEDGELLDSEML